MKINNLKINSFGNLNDKEIVLSDNINIIKGNNESGKSTLLKFIIDIFYGVSRNKRGKEFSDYDRYKPWGKEDFSGKLAYTLDDGRKYEVFREFSKKSPKIYNEDLEDVSKQFTIDKSNGNLFFFDQTKIDETMFVSTLISEQGEVKLDRQTQNFLIQKVANLAGTGDEKISYKKAMDKLNKKQSDEIGTYRTQGKPINVVDERIRQIESEIKEIDNFKDEQYKIENSKNNLETEIQNDEKKLQSMLEIKKIKEIEKLEIEKIKLNEKIKEDNDEKIEQLKKEKSKLIDSNLYDNVEFSSTEQLDTEIFRLRNNQKKSNLLILIVFFVMILLTVLDFVLIKSNIWGYITIFIAITNIIELIIKNIISLNKIKNKVNLQKEMNLELLQFDEQQKGEIGRIDAQIDVLEKNNEKQIAEISDMRSRMNLKINLEKQRLINSFVSNDIDYFLRNDNISYEIECLQNKLNKNKIQIHSLELDKNNIIPKLERLSLLEEELEELKEQRFSLLKDNESIELAKEVLEIAYQKMRENVTPKFTENLSKNIDFISNGKYKNVRINDEDGLIVEKENGEYVSAEKLSVGTIDQLYISLRFAMIKEISNENMPIILDEAFAYYDTERLQNILTYLHTEFKENQILILTCTNRETEILDKQHIEYNFIEL